VLFLAKAAGVAERGLKTNILHLKQIKRPTEVEQCIIHPSRRIARRIGLGTLSSAYWIAGASVKVAPATSFSGRYVLTSH
jgi:hypothetical protein